MGYRIEYDRGNGKYEIRRERLGTFWFAVGTVAVVLILCGALGQGRGAFVRSLVIPGEDTVTVQAFQNMTDDLRSGANLGEALESFCRFVIHGS